MTRWIEALVFVALATALHLAAFANQSKSGVVAGGNGGENVASIKAATSTVAEMVKVWEDPPVTQTQPLPILKAPNTSSGPASPTLTIEQAPRAQMAIALAQSSQDKPPVADTTPPPVAAPKEKAIRDPEQAQNEPKDESQKAKVTSASINKHVAAGSGGGMQAGAGSAEVNAGSSGKETKLRVLWGAKVRARIERNKRSLRGTDGGSATISLNVSRDGRLLSHSLVQSSGNSVLDQAALNTVARTKRVPKVPKGLPGDSFRFSVQISFEPK